MIIVWTDPALADLAALHGYISNDNPAAAAAMVRRIVDLVENQLPRMPDSGRPGRVPQTRELVIVGSPYFVPYRILGDRLEILRVIHGARRWPDVE
ncbi:MAG TPA: type II toxin-antitoxin system RelE/ParE family toxin [Xanthobacteraceae bacterium]|jgi:toxin ParE1/3/4